jgi:hypothetical protein
LSELSKEEQILFNYTLTNQTAFKKLLEPLKSNYFDHQVECGRAVLVTHLVSKLNIDVDIVISFVQNINVGDLLC